MIELINGLPDNVLKTDGIMWAHQGGMQKCPLYGDGGLS